MKFKVAVLLGCCVGMLWALPKMPEGEMLKREEALGNAKSLTREVAPNANSLTFALARYVEVAPDGTDIMWLDFWVKAMTEVGAKELRDVPVPFRVGFSEVEFQVAEVLRADGRMETVDVKANVHEATSNADNEANIYDDLSRQVVLTIPEMGVGDTLHLVVAYNTKKTRIPDTFSEVFTLENVDEPVLYTSFAVKAPKELPLRSVAVLDEVPGTVTKTQEVLANGDTLHRWVARNVPATYEESGMPEVGTQLQRVAISTFQTWEEVSKWYWGLCEPHMQTTPAIDAKVAELTEGKSQAEQIDALFGFVAQGVRYMGIIAEDDAPGYEPHDVSLTFDNRYGVCRDKGALLVAMLRKAGFNAFPVLINAGSKRDKEVPIPYFNHAVVAIDMGDKDYRLMDPTDDTARSELPSYLSDCTYLVCRPEGDTQRITAVPPATDNLMEVTSEGVLDASGALTYRATMVCGGLNDNVYRPMLIKYSAKDVRDRLDGLMKRTLPGAELVSYSYTPEDPKDISQPLTMTVEARVEGYAIPDGEGRTLVTVPFLSRVAGLVNYLFEGLDQPERKYDWEITAPCAVKETLTLRSFGQLGEPTLLPEDPIFKSNGASYDVRVTREQDGTIKMVRNLELLHKSYTPEDYRSLRRFVERVSRAESMRPLFVKQVDQDSDAVVLGMHQSTTLDATGLATRRTQRDVKILTFQGKRSQGEVKLMHNPARQVMTVNAAEVTTAKGDRVSVSEKEINVMDDDNAALAPRYSFPKQTVISLPGIDIGSVSHVDWQVKDTDVRPFAESVVFASAYPTEVQSYTLTTPVAWEADLRIAERNFEGVDVTRTTETKGEAVTRTWTVKNLPALRSERGAPGVAFFKPTIYVALRSSAAHRVLAQVIGATRPLIEADSKKLEETVEGLIAGLDEEDVEGRIRAIQVFLAKRIRPLGPTWVGLPFGTYTAPEKTLTDGYANRMDRLLLQQKMLALAEVETELVFANDLSMQEAFVYKEDLALREVPNWGRWTTPYLRLADGRLLGDEGEFGKIGATTIGTRSLMTATGRILYTQPEDLRAQTNVTTRIVLEPNGDARITLDKEMYGLSAGAVRRAKRDETPELRRRKIAAMAESIATGATPFSAYIEMVNTYPVRTIFGVEAKRYAPRQKDILSLPLPTLVSPLFNLRGAQRQAPIQQDEADPTVRVTDIWLPKGVQILSKPEPFHVLLPGGGAYTLTCDMTTVPATDMVRVTYTSRYEAAPAILQNWQFPALIELDRRLQSPSMQTLLLRLPE